MRAITVHAIVMLIQVLLVVVKKFVQIIVMTVEEKLVVVVMAQKLRFVLMMGVSAIVTSNVTAMEGMDVIYMVVMLEDVMEFVEHKLVVLVM